MTHRDLDRHRDPVLPFRHSTAGGLPPVGAVIESITDVGGRRVSRVRRGDGSTFVVTIPTGGIDGHPGPYEQSTPWIHEDGGGRRMPAGSLDGLIARVGLHVLPIRAPGPSER